MVGELISFSPSTFLFSLFFKLFQYIGVISEWKNTPLPKCSLETRGAESRYTPNLVRDLLLQRVSKVRELTPCLSPAYSPLSVYFLLEINNESQAGLEAEVAPSSNLARVCD